MQRIRVGIIGTGAATEWAILPVLSGADVLSPPDSGAWWSRRPAPSGDIRYQAPAFAEVVALCDDLPDSGKTAARIGAKPSTRLEILARTARVHQTFADARQMLAEVPLDAVFLAEGAGEPAQLAALAASAPGLKNGVPVPRWLWIDGPPARDARALNAFARAFAGINPALWMAAPLRRAGAHRAARRLIERDEIGAVSAIQARFPFALDAARFDAAYAAFDLMLGFAPTSQPPRDIWATRHPDGATQILLRLVGGVHISALFGAADAWNAPLPRVEVCGTQGRFLVCEGGRRLEHFVPREGARIWEPPGLAPHVSAANLAGYSEDIKAFLALCADNPAPFNAERALDAAARSLATLEAAFESLENEVPVLVQARGVQPDAFVDEAATPETPTVPPRNLTLDLG